MNCLPKNKNTRDRKKVPLIEIELDIRRHLQKQEEMPAYDVLLLKECYIRINGIKTQKALFLKSIHVARFVPRYSIKRSIVSDTL